MIITNSDSFIKQRSEKLIDWRNAARKLTGYIPSIECPFHPQAAREEANLKASPFHTGGNVSDCSDIKIYSYLGEIPKLAALVAVFNFVTDDILLHQLLDVNMLNCVRSNFCGISQFDLGIKLNKRL